MAAPIGSCHLLNQNLILKITKNMVVIDLNGSKMTAYNRNLTLKFPVQGVNDGGLGRSRHLSAPL